MNTDTALPKDNVDGRRFAAPVGKKSLQAGTSDFHERALRYQAMQAQLDAAGIDSVWFGVAADVNRVLAANDYGALSGSPLMQDLGRFLLPHIEQAFSEIISGKIDLKGMGLDLYLVQREQKIVEQFVLEHVVDENGWVAGADNLPFTLLANTPLRTLLPDAMVKGMRYVEQRFGEMFSIWNTSHRMALGEALVCQARHGGQPSARTAPLHEPAPRR